MANTMLTTETVSGMETSVVQAGCRTEGMFRHSWLAEVFGERG